MTVSLASLHFRRPARPVRQGPAVLRSGILPAALARRTRGALSGYPFIDLTPLDSLLAKDALTGAQSAADGRGAVAEGRASRLAAARSLLVGGLVAGMLVAAALAGVIAMATDIVQSISEA